MFRNLKYAPRSGGMLFAILVFTFCGIGGSTFGQQLTPDEVDPRMAPGNRIGNNGEIVGVKGWGVQRVDKSIQEPDFQIPKGLKRNYKPHQYPSPNSPTPYQQHGFQVPSQSYLLYRPHSYNENRLGKMANPNGLGQLQRGQLNLYQTGINRNREEVDEVYDAFYKEGDFVKAGKRLTELVYPFQFINDSFRYRSRTVGFIRSQFEKRYAALQVDANQEQCEPVVILLAGYYHYQLGHFDEAERELERYAQTGNPSPIGLRLLSIVRSQRPPEPQAVEQLKKER